MKICDITYQDVETLYDTLNLSSTFEGEADPIIPYDKITNRNFGIKDYTISSNSINDYKKAY